MLADVVVQLMEVGIEKMQQIPEIRDVVVQLETRLDEIGRSASW